MPSDIYVPAEGPKDAQIMFVGEAPGKEEEKDKRPFIGYSGTLFRSTLTSVGLNPEAVYITNTAKYRPPYNNINKFYKGSKPNAKAAEGLAELYRDLAEIKPKVVVPLGNTALWALTGNAPNPRKAKIMKWRGSIISGVTPPEAAIKAAFPHMKVVPEELADWLIAMRDVTVIPTLHPAYVGRQWHMKQVWRDIDLKRIVRYARNPWTLRDANFNYYLDPDRDTATRIAAEVKQAEWVGLDIENPGGYMYCVGFAYSDTDVLVLRWDSAWKQDLIRELCEHDNGKIMQNGWHDMQYLRREGIECNGPYHDTMTAHATCYPEYPKGLDFLVSFYLDGEPYYKDEGKGHKVIDPVQYMTYNGKDCIYTRVIGRMQLAEELKDPSWKATNDYLLRQTEIILGITSNGLAIDIDKFAAHRKKHRKDWREVQQLIDAYAVQKITSYLEHPPKGTKPKDYEKVGELARKIVSNLDARKPGLNVYSSKDLQLFLYTVLGMKVKRHKDTKAPTTEETALKELLAETGDEVLLQIVKAKRIRKKLSSYLKPSKLAPDGRLYGSINPVGTKSRRWSSSKTIEGYGWNLLTTPSPNPKQSIRDIVIPDPGYVLAYYDLSQVEDRIVAYMGNIEQKIWAYENGVDTHNMTAAYLFRDLNDLHYEDPQFRQIVDSIPKKSPERELGKRSNHGYNYEMGPRTFFLYVNKSYDETGIRISYKQAKLFRETHTKVAYPGLSEYWADIRTQLRETRTLWNPFGDKRIFRGRLDSATFRDAYSWIPQSTAPRIIMNGAFEIEEEFPEIHIALQMHDALLLMIPVDLLEQVHERIIDLMTIPINVGGREITVPVDCEGIGWSWGELQKPEQFIEAL